MNKMNKSVAAVICRLLLLAVMLMFTSCSFKDREDELEGFRIYYINADETMVVSEIYEPAAEDTKALIAELIEEFSFPSENDKNKRAKLDAVSIIDYSYDEGKSLTINFESSYYALTGITEVLYRSAIVKTFCQIEGVDLVEFYVRGQPLVLSLEVPVGIMRAEDFLLVDDTLLNKKEEAVVTLYFADENGSMLLPYPVTASYDGIVSTEQLIVKLLLIGPKDAGYYKAVPEGTKINKISVSDTVCYVDLSSEFMEKIPGISEEVIIYSIVNSLIEHTSITHVQFLINGEKRKNYQSMEFSGLFERNLSLIDSEK